MIPARVLTALVLFCGLFLAGCQSPPRVGEITVTVEKLASVGDSSSNSRTIVTLRFINENIIPVALEGSKHKLYLNGTFVGEIDNTAAVGLAPSSTKLLNVSVTFENPTLVQQLAHSGNPVVSYRLINTMEYQQTDEISYLKSETNGTIDLSDLAHP